MDINRSKPSLEAVEETPLKPPGRRVILTHNKRRALWVNERTYDAIRFYADRHYMTMVAATQIIIKKGVESLYADIKNDI
jgi:hypothetical protein